MNWRALIVDDEPPARRRLRRLLGEHPVDVVAEARSVPEARAELLEHPDVDVIFLDVHMPGQQGFDLLEPPGVQASVVFVTAYDVFAVRAFEVHALDYLLKPIEPERLARTLARLRDVRVTSSDIVCVRARSGQRFVHLGDVVCILARDDYSELCLGDGSSELSSVTMSEWEQRLPEESFWRVHRSAIVRLDRLHTLVRRGSSWGARVDGRGDLVPVSRAMAAKLKATFE